MFCQKCGAELSEGTRYCVKCGAKAPGGRKLPPLRLCVIVAAACAVVGVALWSAVFLAPGLLGPRLDREVRLRDMTFMAPSDWAEDRDASEDEYGFGNLSERVWISSGADGGGWISATWDNYETSSPEGSLAMSEYMYEDGGNEYAYEKVSGDVIDGAEVSVYKTVLTTETGSEYIENVAFLTRGEDQYEITVPDGSPVSLEDVLATVSLD